MSKSKFKMTEHVSKLIQNCSVLIYITYIYIYTDLPVNAISDYPILGVDIYMYIYIYIYIYTIYVYFVYLYHQGYIYMTYNLHRKFTITRHFQNIRGRGEKIKNQEIKEINNSAKKYKKMF